MNTATGEITRDTKYLAEQQAGKLAVAQARATRSEEAAIRREKRAEERPKTVPPTVQANLGKQARKVQIIDELLEGPGSFKESYSGGLPFVDELQNKFAAFSEIFAPQSWVDQNVWWGKYRKFLEMKEINELFGAVLSAGEEARWRAAAINPSMSEDTIRNKLGEQKRILKTALDRAQKMAAETYNQPGLRGDIETAAKKVEAEAAPAPQARRYNPATGTLE